MNKTNFVAKLILALLPFFFPSKYLAAQTRPTDPPKLTIGLVVDQMRYDYLLKYYEKFGEGGFKRLLDGGFNCENAHYNYAPTVTGPGHASIFAGATPRTHGILGNFWYSRAEKKDIYCTADEDAKNVGGTEKAGKMSPRRLRCANISDELRLFSNKKSKVVGIALKDRGAILPAGHLPNAAFWFDQKTAGWMTSDWYMDKLPGWVVDFNKLDRPTKLMKNGWSPLPETLREGRSAADENSYEMLYEGEIKSIFPHDLAKIAQKDGTGKTLMNSPFGNNLTAEFAKAAIENEQLGADKWPDLLALSFSSPDIIGHGFGPQSLEIEDVYLRLDRILADFFSYLDEKVGKDQWLVFLSADHGAAENGNYLFDNKITTAGFWEESYQPGDSTSRRLFLLDTLNQHIFKKFEEKELIEGSTDGHIFFTENAKKLANFPQIESSSIDFMEKLDGIQQVLTARQLRENKFSERPLSLFQRGYMPGESGDLVVVFDPGMVDYGERGTTHGSPWVYDTRVPCLFYGWKIGPGTHSGHVDITDIAPTVSIMLNIPFPACTTGEPIEAVLSEMKK